MVIPLMLDMDTLTITVARGLLSPLLLPNPDTDTTDTITARDLLSPPLSPDTPTTLILMPTTLMPLILMPTTAMVMPVILMASTTKFCLIFPRLCHKIGEL